MLENIIFCIKFFFNFLLLKFCIISENKFDKNIKKLLIDAGPIFIKMSQPIISKNLLSNMSDFLDEVYNKEEISYIEINNKKYKVSKDLQNKSGSIANIYLIENFQYNNIIYKNAIVKKPINNYLEKLDISLNKIDSLIKLLKFMIKLKIFNNIKNHTIDIKSNIKTIKNLNFDKIKNELKKNFLIQFDCLKESYNQSVFYRIFKNIENINVPRLYYADNDIIVMEYLKGDNLLNYVHNNLNNIDNIKQIKDIFINILFLMYNNNLFHGDFHYGNILIDDSEFISINLLDFGLVTKLTDNELVYIQDIIKNKNFNIEQDDINNFRTCLSLFYFYYTYKRLKKILNKKDDKNSLYISNGSIKKIFESTQVI